MSLLSDFNAECPLTPKALETYLRKALTEIENNTVFTFNGIDISSIIARDNDTTINDICSIADFNAMFEAVKANNTIKVTIDNVVYIASSANFVEFTSEGYKYVCFTFVGAFKTITGTSTTKVFKFALELLSGSIRLCDKSVVGIT